MPRPMAFTIKNRLREAAATIGTRDPLPELEPTIDRAFRLPEGDNRYSINNLTPGTTAFEAAYSARDPHSLRFTLEPAGPDAPPPIRRDEATREMRRLVAANFGIDALRWFDGRSEEWRSMFGNPHLKYGAWFGTAYDRHGLESSKVYYELRPGQLEALPRPLLHLAREAMDAMPLLMPLFTSIIAERDNGNQRLTFVHRGALGLSDLQPLLEQLGLANKLPGIMQILGLALGGRFDLPDQAMLVGLGGTPQQPEVKIYVLLGMIPDLPPSFLSLLTLGLSERPRELRGLERWLMAYTPETVGFPGDFSVLSIQVTAEAPLRIGLYLRPVEFEVGALPTDAGTTSPEPSMYESVW
ncbi:MAG: hypothetical protein KF716_32365 [Anaerolineae bacterium]|nr:hypothetical protein [Anaerolineae bacterium]